MRYTLNAVRHEQKLMRAEIQGDEKQGIDLEWPYIGHTNLMFCFTSSATLTFEHKSKLVGVVTYCTGAHLVPEQEAGRSSSLKYL